MRSSWLENNQKSLFMHNSPLFTSPETPTKIDYLESKYSSRWDGLSLVSGQVSRSKSPLDRERHGSKSQRTLFPLLQDEASPVSRKRRIHTPTLSVTELPSQKKKFEVSGKIMQKNSYSPLNPMIPELLSETYERHSVTPEKPRPAKQQKKILKQGIKDRTGNLLADKEDVKKRLKTKPDFVSQIASLPGTIKTPVEPQKSGDIERYRARLMLRTEAKPDRFGKQFVEGQGKWKSSYDIIKAVVSNSSNN